MTGYILYGYPTSGSGAVEVALVEANIPFEFREVSPNSGALYDEAFRAVNPRQQVPALVHPDGSVITEIPAILNHLADAHPHLNLAPPPGTSARAQHDRMLAFLHANVYEAVLRKFYSDRYTTDPAGTDGIRSAADAYILRHLGLFAEAIGSGPFYAGSNPGGVDFLLWIMLSWLEPETLEAADPRIARLTQAMNTRPNLSEVITRNTD